MRTIKGKYTSCKIYTAETTNAIDDYALAQLKMLCDNEAFDGCKVRIMPDVHPGKVGTIGFTSTLGKYVLPNVIGIDIGCGITALKIQGRANEFQKLDTIIRENVPSGFSIRSKVHNQASDFDFSELYSSHYANTEKALLSLGTLGGGNHFIELDVSDNGDTYLVIHSGSRHLGKEVTEYYLNEGHRLLKAKGLDMPYEMTILDGGLKDDYLHDLAVVQKFAELNRKIIATEITKRMKWKITDEIKCIHNYVDFSMNPPIIRKGAISAKNGEPVVIPINMRDGIILGHGLGNSEWNYSAPHGSGRVLKREDVKNNYTVSLFKQEMKGIYSSCIGNDTLDEAPFAYRDINSIANSIYNTVSIDNILKPVYNYKANAGKEGRKK